MKLTKIANGLYEGRPFFNHHCTIRRIREGEWYWTLREDVRRGYPRGGRFVSDLDEFTSTGIARTKAKAVAAIEVYGSTHTTTVRSLMSGEDVRIPLDQVGTCCDPSTETYWSM